MREIKLYTFDELSKDAKEYAIESHRYDFVSDWSIDKWNSIKAIANACNMSIITSNYNDTGFANFELLDAIDNYNDVIVLSGSRAIAYVYNNWIKPNIKGKYYVTKGEWINGVFTYMHKHSKCTFEFSCPLTGYYVDDCLIIAYKKFCECVRAKPCLDIADFVNILSECVSECLQADYDYSISDEYVAELLTANSYEFDENGNKY